MALGRTARYYKYGSTIKGKRSNKNPKRKEKHRDSSRIAAAKPPAIKNRVETNKANYNNPAPKGHDKSHKGKKIVNEKSSTNRARGGGKEKGKYSGVAGKMIKKRRKKR